MSPLCDGGSGYRLHLPCWCTVREEVAPSPGIQDIPLLSCLLILAQLVLPWILRCPLDIAARVICSPPPCDALYVPCSVVPTPGRTPALMPASLGGALPVQPGGLAGVGPPPTPSSGFLEYQTHPAKPRQGTGTRRSAAMMSSTYSGWYFFY